MSRMFCPLFFEFTPLDGPSSVVGPGDGFDDSFNAFDVWTAGHVSSRKTLMMAGHGGPGPPGQVVYRVWWLACDGNIFVSV